MNTTDTQQGEAMNTTTVLEARAQRIALAMLNAGGTVAEANQFLTDAADCIDAATERAA